MHIDINNYIFVKNTKMIKPTKHCKENECADFSKKNPSNSKINWKKIRPTPKGKPVQRKPSYSRASFD